MRVANDFSTLYAPLVRDGRMEKFYWHPRLEERLMIVEGIFQEDGLSPAEIARWVECFPDQAIDFFSFFSTLRARADDEQVRQFIHDVGIEHVLLAVMNSASGPPVFARPQFSFFQLKEWGCILLEEQKRVRQRGFLEEYL